MIEGVLHRFLHTSYLSPCLGNAGSLPHSRFMVKNGNFDNCLQWGVQCLIDGLQRTQKRVVKHYSVTGAGAAQLSPALTPPSAHFLPAFLDWML